MSRKGNCWDNAPTESWFSSFKNERICGNRYATRAEIAAETFDYIEVLYNRKRPPVQSRLPVAGPGPGALAYDRGWAEAGSMNPTGWKAKNRGKLNRQLFRPSLEAGESPAAMRARPEGEASHHVNPRRPVLA